MVALLAGHLADQKVVLMVVQMVPQSADLRVDSLAVQLAVMLVER